MVGFFFSFVTKGMVGRETSTYIYQIAIPLPPALPPSFPTQAKTIRNDNSSRFGKYLSIFFSGEGGMVAASLQHYLLEQSRIVAQGRDERNYHVFYHLLLGSPASLEKTQLGLAQAPESYHYLNQSGCTTVESIDEIDRWNELQTAFAVLQSDSV